MCEETGKARPNVPSGLANLRIERSACLWTHGWTRSTQTYPEEETLRSAHRPALRWRKGDSHRMTRPVHLNSKGDGLVISVLDLVGMRAGESAGSAIARSVDLAQHAERWGYYRCWLANTTRSRDWLARPRLC
jgi:hypothetical protein